MSVKTKNINSTKVVQLFQAIKTSERKTVLKFLESPYHNTRKDVVALYRVFLTIKSWKTPIPKVKIVNLVFPDHRSSNHKLHTADDSRLRNTMNALSQLIEQFFALEKWQGDKDAKERYLLDSLIERREYKSTENQFNKTNKNLEKQPLRNSEYFYNKFRLEEIGYYLDIFTRNRKLSTSSTPTQSAFLNYAYSVLMLYYTAELNQATVVNKKIDNPIQRQLLSLVENNKESFSPLIHLYYYTIQTFQDGDNEQYFERSRQLLAQLHTQLSPHDQRNFYGFLINYSNRKIRKGKSNYRQIRAALFLQGLDKKVWNAGVYLATPHYFLHIKNLLEMNKVEAAIAFMHQYQKDINPLHLDVVNHGKNILNLCNAYIEFYRNDFDKSFEYLSLFTANEDPFYLLYVKSLLIKLFYENRIIPTLSNNLKSLQVYLNRNETLSIPVREAYKEFRALLLQLRSMLEKQFHGHLKEQNVLSLITRIEQAEYLIERDWLISKAKEFTSN